MIKEAAFVLMERFEVSETNELSAEKLRCSASRLSDAAKKLIIRQREWMPIESAPKDGSSFWAYEKGYGAHETHWDKDHDSSGGFRNTHHGWSPTQWMPLPNRPQEQDK
jgi:hypothetical protein